MTLLRIIYAKSTAFKLIHKLRQDISLLMLLFLCHAKCSAFLQWNGDFCMKRHPQRKKSKFLPSVTTDSPVAHKHMGACKSLFNNPIFIVCQTFLEDERMGWLYVCVVLKAAEPSCCGKLDFYKVFNLTWKYICKVFLKKKSSIYFAQ